MAGSDIRWGTRQANWILLTTILGSSIAMLDATVVNVALPTLAEDLDAPLSGLQWTVNAYTLTLASFILVGGSLGDRLGRRRIFLIGIAWFAVASLMCGLSQNIWQLVAARALQGIGGALLTPGSLALIQASFVPADRARAIGTWAGLGGVATIDAATFLVSGLLIAAIRPVGGAARAVAPDAATVNVAGQSEDPDSILTLTRRLIRLRREHPVLNLGDFERFGPTPDGTFAFRRISTDGQLTVALNLTDQERAVPGAGPGRVLIGTHRDRDGSSAATDIVLRPNEAVVVEHSR